jgi:hypothetical protein
VSAQKVTIVLTDKPTGNVGCEIHFHPTLKTDATPTPAVSIALKMVEIVAKEFGATKPEVKP